MKIPGDSAQAEAEGAETLRHKGLESDKPLESRSVGTDEASRPAVHLSGKQTEARDLRAPFRLLAA